jgi:hypothetical protein
MNQVRFTRPPRALGRARADNLALVPASLLPFKKQYQAIANNLPAGATLIVTPKTVGKPGQTLGNVAHRLAAKGHQVTVVSATQFSTQTQGVNQ